MTSVKRLKKPLCCEVGSHASISAHRYGRRLTVQGVWALYVELSLSVCREQQSLCWHSGLARWVKVHIRVTPPFNSSAKLTLTLGEG